MMCSAARYKDLYPIVFGASRAWFNVLRTTTFDVFVYVTPIELS